MLTTQQPLPAGTTCVTLEQTFCRVPGVHAHCWKDLQPDGELSGIGAVGLLTQFVSVHLFSRCTVKKKKIKCNKKIPDGFPKTLPLHSSI